MEREHLRNLQKIVLTRLLEMLESSSKNDSSATTVSARYKDGLNEFGMTVEYLRELTRVGLIQGDLGTSVSSTSQRQVIM
jgi:hypothetical protein